MTDPIKKSAEECFMKMFDVDFKGNEIHKEPDQINIIASYIRAEVSRATKPLEEKLRIATNTLKFYAGYGEKRLFAKGDSKEAWMRIIMIDEGEQARKYLKEIGCDSLDYEYPKDLEEK